MTPDTSDTERERVEGFVTAQKHIGDGEWMYVVQTAHSFPRQDPPKALLTILHDTPSSSEGRLRCPWPECGHTWETTLRSEDYVSCPKCHQSLTINRARPDSEDEGEDVLGRESKSGAIPWDEPMDAAERRKEEDLLREMESQLDKLKVEIERLEDEGDGEGSMARTVDDAFDRVEGSVDRLEDAVETTMGTQVPEAEKQGRTLRTEATESPPPGSPSTEGDGEGGERKEWTISWVIDRWAVSEPRVLPSGKLTNVCIATGDTRHEAFVEALRRTPEPTRPEREHPRSYICENCEANVNLRYIPCPACGESLAPTNSQGGEDGE